MTNIVVQFVLGRNGRQATKSPLPWITGQHASSVVYKRQSPLMIRNQLPDIHVGSNCICPGRSGSPYRNVTPEASST